MSADRSTLESIGGVKFAIADVDESRLVEPLYAEAPPRQKRGLALKELTLHGTHEGLISRFWHWLTRSKDKDEIFFVSTAFDFSGMKPFVWPPDPATAGKAVIPLAAGETHTWTLGDGAPIFPVQEIEGGLAVAIIVSDSDSGVRKAGDIIAAIAKAVDVKGAGFLTSALALAGPGGLTAAGAVEVLGKLTAVVGEVLKENTDDYVGAFAGLFPPNASWAGKLEQAEEGVSIKLVEIDGGVVDGPAVTTN